MWQQMKHLVLPNKQKQQTHTHMHTKAHLYAVLRLFGGSDLHDILNHVVISIMLVSFYKCIHTPLFK